MFLYRKKLPSFVFAALLGLVLPGTMQAGSLTFAAVDVPVTDQDKRTILASPRVVIEGVEHRSGFHPILRSGDRFSANHQEPATEAIFGKLVDIQGKDILQEDGSPRISSNNDFASLINLGPGALFMVSHFETLPGAMYLTELLQNPDTGHLTAVDTRPIDFSVVGGGWLHCAGSLTPWNTHLGSEEYEPDARTFDVTVSYGANERVELMAQYFPGGKADLNPYHYGWPVEVRVLNGGKDTKVVKHYAMGRVSLELAYVLPDKRTAYLTDDGTGVGLYLFVADTPGDLRSGTLYAAQWTQQPGNEEQGGQAKLGWHNLGPAKRSQIAAALKTKIGFAELFETANIDPDDGGRCAAGYVSTNHGHDTGQPYVGHECLKLRPGTIAGVPIGVLASRLETRRYAAMRGATTEFRKMEGITYDPHERRLYLAMSEISKGMEGDSNSEFDRGGPNHIRLPKNECGVVYSLGLKGGVKDSDGAPIASNLVAYDMKGVLAGRPANYPDGDPFAGNTCDVNRIANPDNLTFISGYSTLIIAEDSGSGHQNDAVWAYHVETRALTRIQTTPYGSEATAVYFYPNVNGWAYIMSVVQHPYGDSDSDQYRIGSLADRAYTGYLGPFPRMDQ